MLSTIIAFSQQQEEMVSIPKSQLTQQQKADLAVQDVEDKINIVGKYAGLGKEIGEAVNGGLSALTHNVDTFANSKAGKFTMFMIAYKIMGTDIIQFAIGVPYLIIVIIMSIVYYIQNIRTRKVSYKRYYQDGKVQEDTFKLLECDNDKIWGWITMTAAFILLGLPIIFA